MESLESRKTGVDVQVVSHEHTDGLSAETFSLSPSLSLSLVLLLGRNVGDECNITASFFSLSCFITRTYIKSPDDVIFTPCCQLLPRREQIILLLQRTEG